jgi:PPOX class probable F420-dependent enzyme
MVAFDQIPERDRVLELLQERKIAWLATTRPSGRPHFVPVWFLWENDMIFVLSRPDTQKIVNLIHQPLCSLALDDSTTGREPVVLDGRATLVDEPFTVRILDRYLDKYAQILADMEWDAFAMLAEFSQGIRIEPRHFVHLS